MKTAKQFYTKLTPEVLASRKKKIHTQKELAYLIKLFNKRDKILDLACGYGRFTIPLAKKGYNIEGIDITPVLIEKARKDAKKERLSINFRVGDMRKLPYKENSFNKIICMWSAFLELANKKDQLMAVKEMKRALISRGFVIIDMPLPLTKSKVVEDKKMGDKFVLKKGQRLYTKNIIANIVTNPSYRHDKKTLTNLMRECKIKKFKIFKTKYGERTRFFLQFWKE
jgi:ubiquinone/menaquinone biosynthesis C-methylase UbiE